MLAPPAGVLTDTELYSLRQNPLLIVSREPHGRIPAWTLGQGRGEARLLRLRNVNWVATIRQSVNGYPPPRVVGCPEGLGRLLTAFQQVDKRATLG
jgi:hypothetical protein